MGWVGIGIWKSVNAPLLRAPLCDAKNIHRPHDFPSLKESQTQHPEDDPT